MSLKIQLDLARSIQFFFLGLSGATCIDRYKLISSNGAYFSNTCSLILVAIGATLLLTASDEKYAETHDLESIKILVMFGVVALMLGLLAGMAALILK